MMTRKEYLPLAGPQIKIAVAVCAPVVVASISVSVFITYFILSSLRSHGALSSNLAKEIIPMVGVIVVINLLLLLAAFAIFAIFVGFRIVGPMRRMARELEDIGSGKLYGRFVLRPKDEMTFLADSLNRMREMLIESIGNCSRSHAELECALEDCKQDPRKLDAVLAKSEATSRALSHFIIEPPPTPSPEENPRAQN